MRAVCSRDRSEAAKKGNVRGAHTVGTQYDKNSTVSSISPARTNANKGMCTTTPLSQLLIKKKKKKSEQKTRKLSWVMPLQEKKTQQRKQQKSHARRFSAARHVLYTLFCPTVIVSRDACFVKRPVPRAMHPVVAEGARRIVQRTATHGTMTISYSVCAKAAIVAVRGPRSGTRGVGVRGKEGRRARAEWLE